jgi:3-phenylpropionate/trans-cinnamate dioxygenase ferredoxin subunit
MKWIKLFDSQAEFQEKVVFERIFNVSVNGILISILRKEQGIFAFRTTCPHAGASLANGFVNSSEEIVCPLHGYRFSLKDGKEKSGHSCELPLYATDMRENGFYVGLR